MNEELPLLPDLYGEDMILTEFENMEMLNLLKGNLEVLPAKFHDKLATLEQKEVGKGQKQKEFSHINIDKAMKNLEDSE